MILKVISSFLDKTASSSSFLDLVINQSINNPLINNKDPIIEIKESNNIIKVPKRNATKFGRIERVFPKERNEAKENG